ncbi:hypothetical protein GCM10010381_43060 [Streptomyces xantholiticus]|nr:hypothetical protein GCM10010381_43060 [Streptomyces xantholiticus]
MVTGSGSTHTLRLTATSRKSPRLILDMTRNGDLASLFAGPRASAMTDIRGQGAGPRKDRTAAGGRKGIVDGRGEFTGYGGHPHGNNGARQAGAARSLASRAAVVPRHGR